MSATYVVTGTVAAPEMSHISGIYNEAIELSLTTATAGAQIRYTTDGSDPDENSNLYSEPITIPDLAQNFIVKAKAFKADWISSSVTSATYSVLLLPMDVRAYSYAGYIRVLWNTPIVPRSLDGFDVYRRKLNETVFVKMNSTIIPASQELVYHYDDYQVQTNQSYQYYLVAIYNAVSSNPSVTTTVEYQSQDLVISDATHAYPNPATTSTKIKMIMTRNENVQISVSIFDFAGKKVRTLTVPTTSVNLIEIPWDLKNSSGEKVGRGTYFARIVANDGVKRAEKIVKIAVK